MPVPPAPTRIPCAGSLGSGTLWIAEREPMTTYGPDIYTEPDGDPDTLANLGPLRPMAGVWEGTKGADEHPVVDGDRAGRVRRAL